VSIDKSGRIIVPKPIRDRLGLRPESKLDLVENEDGFQLIPVDNPARLARRPNGRLVFTGAAPPGVDWDHLVDDMRQERMRKIEGRRTFTSTQTSSSPTPFRPTPAMRMPPR